MALACSNSATAMSATYNSVSMTFQFAVRFGLIQSNWLQVFTLMSPATGANTLAFTGANKVFNATVASYSGVSTSGQPEATSTISSTIDTQTQANSVTTVTNNAWVIGGWGANAQPTAYTNATARASNTFPYLADSNAALTPAGSKSMTADIGGGTTPWAMMQIAIAPAAAAGPVNLKSYDGNVKSNIKSMNGNLIANVKSFDGNS